MIDWDFIAAREGGCQLKGYVPSANSGVTIATGIDLGYYDNKALVSLSEATKDAILPYLGLTGSRAQKALNAQPLTVTPAQAAEIETPKRNLMLVNLSTHFVRDAAEPFEKQPDPAQTVLLSVTWQYGSPWKDCPKFWKASCTRDWPAVVKVLRKFEDAYPTRRNLEADYLVKGLNIVED